MRILLIIISLFINLNVIAQIMTPTYIDSIPMRDGKKLAADVYVPTSCTSCPTILIQTPYNKNLFRLGLPLGYQQDLSSSPYSWVIVDWRGFYGSSSATIASPKRGEDGYDVIDWIVSQSWSNGKVGTWGPSALGVIQYQTAKEHHPNHVCAVPVVAHPQTDYQGYFYGGVLEKSRLEQLDGLGYGLSPIILANPYYSTYWQFAENSTWYPGNIYIPTLQIGGWYDHNIDKMVDWYAATRASADINVRDEQWLLVGPWVHGGTGTAKVGTPNQGELTYSNATYENDTKALAFLDYYLLNSANNWTSTPYMTYYELGKNTWNTSSASDIAISTNTDLFLKENGVLSTISSATGSSSLISDPKNPSPTIGGPTLSDGLEQGPYDQSSLDGRSDIVTFTSGELLTDVSISGRVKINLYVQCDQPDADIAIRMVDLYPDGTNMLINDGIKRMRFRNGYTQADEAFMTSGQVYNVEVGLPFTNYTWLSGHKIKIYVSGNSATRWDVNLQNGSTMYASGDTNTANIQIHHSNSYPSKVTLPSNTTITTSISKKTDSFLINLFPNPVKDELTVDLTKVNEALSYTIFDQMGTEMIHGKGNNRMFKISCENLKPGMYYIRFEYDSINQTLKFIKE